MIASLYNLITFNWMKDNSQSESKNESQSESQSGSQSNSQSNSQSESQSESQSDPKSNFENDYQKEINLLILKKAKKFLSDEKIDDMSLNISPLGLEKFLNGIKKILPLCNKKTTHDNILNFIENETEFMYFGIKKNLANVILKSGWNKNIRIRRNNNCFGAGDYFTNQAMTSYHLGGGIDSAIILALVIKPDFTGKYYNVIKYYTDKPYNMKWNYIIDNTDCENYSLALSIISE